MLEIWKDVVGYEGLYQVSNLGRVRSTDKYDRLGRFHTGKILAIKDNGAGYLTLPLNRDGKHKMMLVHRMVAKAFVDNPNGYPQVNHIDGDKTNNVFTNLEWCTQSHNVKHAVNLGLHTEFGQKKVVCLETGMIFNSTVEAEKWVGIKPGNSRISSCCYQRRGAKTCGGFHWRYLDDLGV